MSAFPGALSLLERQWINVSWIILIGVVNYFHSVCSDHCDRCSYMRVTCRQWATRRDIITGASCNSGKMLAASASYSVGSLTSLPYANVCVWLHATRSTAVLYTVEYINIHGFYHVIPNLVVRNEPNLDCFQGKRCDGAMLKILVMCVSWFARKLVYRQTDRRTDTAIT